MSFRLQSLLTYRVLLEREARRELQARLATLRQLENEEAETREDLAHHLQCAQEQMLANTTVDWMSYVADNHQRQSLLKMRIRQAEADLTTARDHHLQSWQERRILEILKDRATRRENERRDRQLESVNDVRRARRRTRIVF